MTNFLEPLPFEIRLFRPQPMEENQLLALAEELQSPEFHWPWEKLKAQLNAQGKTPSTQTFMALSLLEPSRIHAFACFEDQGVAVEIPVLATAKTSQSQGLMRLFLQEIIQIYYSHRELWLEVHENNQKARGLYKKLGFIEVGQRPKYYQDGGCAVLYSRFPQNNKV